MSSGIFTSSGADLDNVFEFYSSGTKVGSTNIFHANGNDLANVYAPLSQGSAAGPTNVYSGNSDLNSLFAAKGTVSTWDGSLAAVPAGVVDSRSSPQFPGYSLAEILFFADGTIRQRTADSESVLGNWSGSLANSSNTEVRFEIVSWNGIGSVSGATGSFGQVNFTRAVSINTSSGNATTGIRISLREIGKSGDGITVTTTLTASYINRGLEEP
jgi:hypothetical protein